MINCQVDIKLLFLTQSFLNKEHHLGGVVSPLLANIALNGIETINKYKSGGLAKLASGAGYAVEIRFG
ncbi:hypothetical protein [Nostoc sp.]|uniref:hypothetical protein n=1 Tax=Nostoc sp. TaxID=1180 RepID=UPI002FFBFE08